jgi:cytoskeletal protein RodZ
MSKPKLLKGEELKRHAEELGVSMSQLYDTKGHMDEPELQRRVLEAERSVREGRLWWIALISAVIALLSAAAAWMAVYAAWA